MHYKTYLPKLRPDVSNIMNRQNCFDPNTSHSNFNVDDFVKNGELSQARQLFDQRPHKKTISTNMMISSYVKSSNLGEARQLFDCMSERTVITWPILIGGYSKRTNLRKHLNFSSRCRGVGLS